MYNRIKRFQKNILRVNVKLLHFAEEFENNKEMLGTGGRQKMTRMAAGSILKNRGEVGSVIAVFMHPRKVRSCKDRPKSSLKIDAISSARRRHRSTLGINHPLLLLMMMFIMLVHSNRLFLCTSHAFVVSSFARRLQDPYVAFHTQRILSSYSKRPSRHAILLSSSPYDNEGDDNRPEGDRDADSRNMSVLSQRIQALQAKESSQEESLQRLLQTRVQELKASESMEEILNSQAPTVLELPVLALDALLPQQIMEGRTEDPTFCVFLRQLGLGGYFVMTSLDPGQRKIRRHGVLAKIVAVDAIKNDLSSNSSSPSGNEKEDPMTCIPTAVDFTIIGQSRCRIVVSDENASSKDQEIDIPPSKRMNKAIRMGRWRRMHDPNGEEVVLGWSDERLVDLSPDAAPFDYSQDETNHEGLEFDTRDCTKWNNAPVLVNLDSLERKTIQYDSSLPDYSSKLAALSQLVDDWYSLASNVQTYTNLNVTCATRIQKGAPGLWVEPNKLLARVMKQLGPRPDDDANALVYWAAALINPLPALGVSVEVRGRLLEAATIKQRLEILEWGLRRSIHNLKGTQPLL